jgi:hypothetical protein
MTLDVYLHILPGLQEAVVRAFNDGLKVSPESAVAPSDVE